MPALKGKTLAQAKGLLKARKCTLGRVTRVFHAKVRSGRIVKQSPLAGQKRPLNAKVAVVVSRGKRR